MLLENVVIRLLQLFEYGLVLVLRNSLKETHALSSNTEEESACV